jgi:hypothetical protein
MINLNALTGDVCPPCALLDWPLKQLCQNYVAREAVTTRERRRNTAAGG